MAESLWEKFELIALSCALYFCLFQYYAGELWLWLAASMLVKFVASSWDGFRPAKPEAPAAVMCRYHYPFISDSLSLTEWPLPVSASVSLFWLILVLCRWIPPRFVLCFRVRYLSVKLRFSDKGLVIPTVVYPLLGLAVNSWVVVLSPAPALALSMISIVG